MTIPASNRHHCCALGRSSTESLPFLTRVPLGPPGPTSMPVRDVVRSQTANTGQEGERKGKGGKDRERDILEERTMFYIVIPLAALSSCILDSGPCIFLLHDALLNPLCSQESLSEIHVLEGKVTRKLPLRQHYVRGLPQHSPTSSVRLGS